MSLITDIRKWFSRGPLPSRDAWKESLHGSASLCLEVLEDRVVPATIELIGTTVNFEGLMDSLDPADNVAVSAANDVITVFTGTDNIQINNNPGGLFDQIAPNKVEIDTAVVGFPVTDFNINLGDVDGLQQADLKGDKLTFFSTDLTPNLTAEAETIQIDPTIGGIKGVDSDVTLTSWQELQGRGDTFQDIAAEKITLKVTGLGNQLGNLENFAPLVVNAEIQLDASTNNGDIFLADSGLPTLASPTLQLGTLDAGNALIGLNTLRSITDGLPGDGPNLRAVAGAQLNVFTLNPFETGTIGLNSNAPLRTEIGALSATTHNGGIFVNNSGDMAVGTVLAQQAVFITENNQSVFKGFFPPVTFGDQVALFVISPDNVIQGTHDVWIQADGNILVGGIAAPNKITITSTGGSADEPNIAAIPGLANVNVLAQEVEFKADHSVGQLANPIQMQVETFSATTTDGGIFLGQGSMVSTAHSVVANGANKDIVVTSTGTQLLIREIRANGADLDGDGTVAAYERGNVTVTNESGTLEPSTLSGTVPVTGNVVELTGASGIGSLPLDGIPARGVLTFTGAGSPDDAIAIGSRIYTLVTNPSGDGEVEIGADAEETASNLADAINADVDSQVTAVADDGIVVVTAKDPGAAGNSIFVFATTTNNEASWSTQTLVGGSDDGTIGATILDLVPLETDAFDLRATATNPAFDFNPAARIRIDNADITQVPAASASLTFVETGFVNETITIGTRTYTLVSALSGADQVLIGANATETASNLAFAISADAAQEGIAFGTGTVAHADVSATANSNLTQVKAKVEGSTGNYISVSASGESAVWDSSTLRGGRNASVGATTEGGDVLIEFPSGALFFSEFTQVLSASSEGGTGDPSDDVSISFANTAGNVRVDQVLVGSGDINITASAAIVDYTNKNDPNPLDDTDDGDSIPEVDLVGNRATLTANFSIGLDGFKIETEVAELTATTALGTVSISEADDLILSASTAGDFVDFATFASTPSNIDVTTGGDLTLKEISAVKQVTLNAGGSILDGNTASNNITAATLDLTAASSIGNSPDDALETSVTRLTVVGQDDVFLTNNKSFTLSSVETGGEVSVTSKGNLELGTVTADSVTLTATGRIIDDNDLLRVDTKANSIYVGDNHGLFTGALIGYANNGDGEDIGGLVSGSFYVVLLEGADKIKLVDGTTGTVVDLTSRGSGEDHRLQSGFFILDFKPSETLQSNVNITATTVTLTGSRIGDSVLGNGEEEPSIDRIELKGAESLTATAARGGIYVHNESALTSSLTLTATARGREGDIDIETQGNILLRTLTALGNSVTLRADGSILDDPANNEDVNITARTFDVVAPGGIGTLTDPLETQVDEQGNAAGGVNGSFLFNVGALLITEATLTGSGSGPLTFEAESLTIDISGTVQLEENRDLVFRTTTGNIVFLDSESTIEALGTGKITIQAGTKLGGGNLEAVEDSQAVAVLGTLITAHQNIRVSAVSTITIGELNAGTADVSVRSLQGIIVDGNGTDVNVRAGSATLSGNAPTAREAELDETFKIAEAASLLAEAAAKLASFEAFESGAGIVLDAELQAEESLATAEVAFATAQALVDFQEFVVAQKQHSVDVIDGILTALNIVQLQTAGIAAAAQAVPVSGDVGLAAIAFVLDVAVFATEKIALGLETELEIVSDALDDFEASAATAQAQLFAAQAGFTQAEATAEAFEESFSIAEAAFSRTRNLSAAAAIVQDQAIVARDQINVIGSASAPLGIQVTGVVNVVAGPTDSYLEVTGPTNVDLIDASGSVTLISKGAITDSDGTGDDILAIGLIIVAEGGIGTTADPLETHVGTLNATNTSSGDIAIANTAGDPAALDITGISNEGGGDVIITSIGDSATGQGITVSGPISAMGAGADVILTSGSPLTIAADITAVLSIPLTATDTAGAGDDLTVNSGVTIHSIGSSVELNAGDNVLISAGSTIQAASSISITADAGIADAAGANVVVAGALIAPAGATITGGNDSDTFTITPSAQAEITVDGQGGSDTLFLNANGLPVTIEGNTIEAGNLGLVTFNGIEFVHIINAEGGGSITLQAESGNTDLLVLTGTGEGSGTFTLNSGVPISFSGVTSFEFNAKDLDDRATVTPLATATTPWNVAVNIDGGTGVNRITYNNVAGLSDNTNIIASGLKAGRIESPGVTSVTFANVEDIVANANLGETETLTVKLRDTSAPDAASVRFDSAPGAADVQLLGLFNVDVDTDNYVGLTLDGGWGNNTFHVAPGPIPVLVDGSNPAANDRLAVEDEGEGDLVVLQPAPDQLSGRVSVAPGGGVLADVIYSGVERVDITPLNPVTGGTGTDGHGRIVVFHPDPFEFNDSRLNATPMTRLSEGTTSPTINPGGITDPFNLSGDEDWYEFRPTSTNQYQIRALFDEIGTLANGNPGLPGDGALSLDIYDASGNFITSGVVAGDGNLTAVFAATNDPASPEFNRIFVRVKGAGAQPSISINRYDFEDSGSGGTTVLSTSGPQITGVNITTDPDYNLFVPKPSEGPTPLVPSLEVHFTSDSERLAGFLFPVIDPALFEGPVGQKPAMGLFSVVGDLVGNVPILDVVLNNDPVVEGELATATVTILFDLSSPTFAGGLPDDRYTLIVHDGLSDPTGSRLDGESNAATPTPSQSLPSGNGQAGGEFTARFTVDARPEVGTFGNGTSFIDLNGNGTFDPQGSGDVVHHDNVFPFGLDTDTLFAGNFAATDALEANGYDKLGAYGKVNGRYRFLLDLTGDGVPSDPIVPTRQINGTPVAGDFAPDHPGDEIGVVTNNRWYLDTDGNNDIDFDDLVIVNNNLHGLPFVGDFDGDGLEDLGTYDPVSNTFEFDLANNGYGQLDTTITFGFPGVREQPVAADMNQDGVTDIGLYVPRSEDSSETLAADWYFLVSDGTPMAGSVNTLDHPFNQTPFSNDLYYTFGDSFFSPIVGNFDPPIANSIDVGDVGTNPPPQTPVVIDGPSTSEGSTNGTTQEEAIFLPESRSVSSTSIDDTDDTVPINIPSTSPRTLEKRLAVGADAGGAPLVKVYDEAGNVLFGFFAYDLSFAGGVRVATGDINGDFVEDIVTVAGPGGGPHVKIFDGTDGSLITEFFAYGDGFTGGVFVAVGDVDNDGFNDIVTGAGAGGGPHVRVFSGSGKGTLADFFAYNPAFLGGVTVSIGDVDNDGFGDIITGAGAGGTPHVRVFSGAGKGTLADFFAFDAAFQGGVFVASGDLNNNGFSDLIVAAGAGGAPHVRAFDGGGAGTLVDFLAFDGAFLGGTRVTTLDRDVNVGDELVVGAGHGGDADVRTFDVDPFGEIDSFFALDGLFTGGLFVG